MKINKSVIGFIVVCVVVAVIALVAVIFGTRSTNTGNNVQPPMQACTLEAKLCPDGSYVGRDSGLNCEFTPCPGTQL